MCLNVGDGRSNQSILSKDSSYINAVECPEKLGGGGGGAQSNFPTRDHQNIFNLILI